MRRIAIGVALALVGAACSPFGEEQPLSEMELQRVSGKVFVMRAGERLAVDEVIALQPRDVIETLNDSEAKLRLEGSRLAAMLEHTELEVLSPDTLHARTGSVMVKADERMDLTFDEVTASTAAGIFRVDQGIATARAGVYKGSVSMAIPGEPPLSIHELFEAPVTANDIPSAARPYRLNVADPWDARWLSHVVSLEQELDRLARGLGNQVGKKKPSLAYFRALSNVKDVAFMRDYLDEKPEDLLVGFTVADNASSPLAPAFRRAFTLFEQGGAWGMIAAIMEVKGRVVLADLERIIVGTGLVAGGTGGQAAFTIAAAESAESGSLPPFAGGSGDDGSGGGGGDNDGGGKPKPKPSPTAECEDVVDCTVSRLRPTPEPTPTDPGILPLGLL